MILVDQTITIGNILEFSGFVGTGLMIVYRLGRKTQELDMAIVGMSKDINELKDATKQIGNVLQMLATQKERLEGHRERIESLERKVDNMRVN